MLIAENELLYESEKLHLTALELSTMAFGERNVQTAKHYGNLGRLYQSMKKFKVGSKDFNLTYYEQVTKQTKLICVVDEILESKLVK